MEELCIRFSHLSEKIFDSLDNESLINCKDTSRFWFNYLNGQKFVEIRIIRATVEKFHLIGESWVEIFNSALTETLLALGVAVDQFYIRHLDKKYNDGLTPLHTAE
jgi:hypothetical protein